MYKTQELIKKLIPLSSLHLRIVLNSVLHARYNVFVTVTIGEFLSIL